jgi:hypothetical protein
MHVTKILSTHNHSFGTTSMRSCSSYGTNVPDGDSTPSPWYLVQVVDGYVGNPAAFPARPFCWSVQAVFARFARCGHIWETHGSAGATVGVGYGTALAAGIQRLQRVKRPSTQTTARACMHGRPPCRPNSPRLHDHARADARMHAQSARAAATTRLHCPLHLHLHRLITPRLVVKIFGKKILIALFIVIW